MVDFKAKLSDRIGMDDINEMLRLTEQNDKRKQELYDLVIGEDEKIGYHAAWIFTHFSPEANKWLYRKQDELINEVMTCEHGGKRRLILNLLYKQPLADTLSVNFLNFCLERMLSVKELPGVQSLCMKIAYELSRTTPELRQELKATLEIMEGELCPAIRSARKNILKAIPRGKSLQKY